MANTSRDRAADLALLFQELRVTLDEIKEKQDSRERALMDRVIQVDQRLTQEVHSLDMRAAERNAALDLKLSTKIENLTVRAGAWGAIGGAITLAVPLGMALLLWILKGT